MKYTPELTKQILADYSSGKSPTDIALALELPENIEVVKRSIIAKLSSLGVYKKQEYRTKRGELPVKKEEYISRIAKALQVQVDTLESLEKVNKNVLILLEKALKEEEVINIWSKEE